MAALLRQDCFLSARIMKRTLLPLLLLPACMHQRVDMRIDARDMEQPSDLTCLLQLVTEGVREGDLSGILETQYEDIPFTLSITSKGNGILSLPGLEIQCFDAHDNGRLYPPPHWAAIRMVDMNADDYLDLAVDYTILHTGEKEEDATRTTRSHEEFLYCPEDSVFKPR